MNRLFAVVLATLVLAVTGCASVTQDIKVQAESDPKVSISGYKSYAWLGAAAIVFDDAGRWEPPQYDVDAELKFYIDRELRKRGMTESSSNPDLAIAFAAGIDMDDFEFIKDPDSQLESLQNIPKGALVIALVDVRTGDPVWVGVAEGNLKENVDIKTSKERLNYAVTEMFKKLPK
ncbi:MAG: DUF4136 domain-containing protein [Halopseudomonas sp.]